MSLLVNSSVGNTIFGTNGSAIAAQPDNTKTTAVATHTTSDNSNPVNEGYSGEHDGSTGYQAIAKAINGVTMATQFGISYSSVANNGGNLQIVFTGGPSTIKTGDRMLTNLGYVTSVVAVASNSITVTIPHATRSTYISADAQSLASIYLPKDFMKGAREDVFQILGYSSSVAGASNEAIKGGGTSPNRDVNKVETIRTRRVGTAIRNNYWDEINGVFTTAPTVANDYASIPNDLVSSGTGRVTFEFGSNNPSNSNY